MSLQIQHRAADIRNENATKKAVGKDMKRTIPIALLAPIWILCGQNSTLKIEQFMTPQELQQTGVSLLSPQQREALNRWLFSYTMRVAAAAASVEPKQPNARTPSARATGSYCAPAIESTISGEFKGWSGDTIFKLDNGQIWQQAEYEYTYSYAYRPNVTIYQTSSGCRMKVEDKEETILVRRIK
jgi:hypothetical protein